MSFGNPAAFWALAVLLVPLAIHLLGKKEQPARPVGSTRFLAGHEPRKQASFLLQQKALLLLRLLIFGLLILGLADPQFSNSISGQQKPNVILVSPNVDIFANRALLDSLLKVENTEAYLATAGLPQITQERINQKSNPPEQPTFWSGLQDADARRVWPDTLYVLGKPWLSQLIGQKPRTTKAFVPLEVSSLRYAKQEEKPLQFAAIYTDSLEQEAAVWEAIFRYTQALIPRPVSYKIYSSAAALPDSLDVLVRLGVPNQKTHPAELVYQYAAEDSSNQWFRTAENNIHHFGWRAKDLEEKPGLADQVMVAWLQTLPYFIGENGPAATEIWQPQTVEYTAFPAKTKEGASPWWWLLVILLFLSERIWSLNVKK
jgi:hypothetical protein